MNKRYWMSRLVLVLAVMALCQISAFAADGNADPTFNPNSNGVVYAIAAQSDGLLLVGGNFTNIGGQPRNYLARLNPITGLADSFNPNVIGGTVFKVNMPSEVVSPTLMFNLFSRYSTISSDPRSQHGPV